MTTTRKLLTMILLAAGLAACGGPEDDFEYEYDETTSELRGPLEPTEYCEDGILIIAPDGVRCLRELQPPRGGENPDPCAAQITCVPPAGSNAVSCQSQSRLDATGNVTCQCVCI